MSRKETHAQAAVVEFVRSLECEHPGARYLFGIPNAARRSYALANQMRREGLLPGIPDLFLPVAKGGYHGVFCEMKRRAPKGRLTVDQEETLHGLSRQGYHTFVAYGADAAINEFLAYLRGGRVR